LHFALNVAIAKVIGSSRLPMVNDTNADPRRARNYHDVLDGEQGSPELKLHGGVVWSWVAGLGLDDTQLAILFQHALWGMT
jgi:hypothetical protein